MFRVVITDFINDDLALERRVLGDLAEIVACDAHTEDDLAGKIDDADAVMLYHNLSLSAATVERLTRCKLIVRCGVGYDNVDRECARRRGILVANVPDYGTEEVADSAIALMLSLTRGTHLFNSRLRESRLPWSYTPAAPLYRLRGRVFGMVGLGRIGTATALRAKSLGMDVCFYDPYTPDGSDKAIGVRRVESLNALLEQSFVLSLHCPLTHETRHLIGAAEIARLPKGAFLVNTARGAVLDTAAVPPALASGQLAGAGIDVLAVEPPEPNDPLLVAWRDPNHPAYDRLIVNPHAAFYSVEGLTDMRVKGSEAVRRVLTNDRPRNVVN